MMKEKENLDNLETVKIMGMQISTHKRLKNTKTKNTTLGKQTNKTHILGVQPFFSK